MAERKKLGELLMEGGLIDQYQLKSALAHQRQWGGRLGANLVKLGFLTEDQIVSFLSKTLNVPSINLYTVKIPPPIIGLIPKDIAKKYGVIPLQQSSDKKSLVVAMADPSNLLAIDELQFLVHARIVPVVASDTAIEAGLAHYYDQSARMEIEPGARLSTEIDFSAKAPSVTTKRVKTASVSGKIDLADDEEVVVASDAEPQPDFSKLDTAGLDEVLVFAGGAEKTITLDGTPKETAREAAPPAPAAPRQVAAGQPKSPTPNAEQLVMALIRLLIDKGFITKEELLARLK